MAKEAKNIVTTICDEQCTLGDKLRPKHCARFVATHQGKKKGGGNTSKSSLSGKKSDHNAALAPVAKPGAESYRKSREHLTTFDKLHMALTELCYSINYCNSITVWEYTFAPREYLYQQLEARFARALVGMASYDPETSVIAKPTELLDSVRAYMNVLQLVENYVHLDVSRVFNNVLLQQTQQQDPHGEKTIAHLYCHYYTTALLNRVKNSPPGHIVYSPCQKSFVSLTALGAQPFNVEEFSDVNELRALSDLIGPYGMKLLNETLVWEVAREVADLKKLVLLNKDTLLGLRSNFDKPEQMKELARRLTSVESLLARMTNVGIILCFRNLAQGSMNDCLKERIPFLLRLANTSPTKTP
jgi:NCK-associated protein 1